jgi:hypothetical protein
MVRRTHPAPRLDPDIARLAGALADPSRIAMLDALLDGGGHLRRLLDEQLVVVTRRGRERHIRLAGPSVAQLLESLAALAAPPPAITTASATRARELRFARTCYDHLAGVVGVRVTGALLDRGWLRQRDDGFTGTPALLGWLADHGRPLADEPRMRRPLARACLDWSERTPHLACACAAVAPSA